MGQSDRRVALSASVVEVDGILTRLPDRGEPHAARAMQCELQPTIARPTGQFRFDHLELIGQQVFLLAEYPVNVGSKIVERANSVSQILHDGSILSWRAGNTLGVV